MIYMARLPKPDECEMIETTCLLSTEREYTYGMRNAGTASVRKVAGAYKTAYTPEADLKQAMIGAVLLACTVAAGAAWLWSVVA